MAEDLHRLFERFQRRFGETVKAEDRTFVCQALEDAEETVLDFIGRDKLPARLDSVVVELAVIAYNKLGAEGASSRSEGGISISFDDLPPDIRKRLDNYPRKVGVIRAHKEERPDDDAAVESNG